MMLVDIEANENRRKHERFALALRARIEMVTSKGKQVMDLLTRDVSAGGAFLNTRESIPEGTQVKLELTASNERLRKLTGAHSLIKVQGKVVRSDPTGIAISFDRSYRILGVKS